MKYDINDGRIRQAHWQASPNYDARPHPEYVNSIIIHAISLPPERFGGQYVEQFFCNHLTVDDHPYFRKIADLRVSAHFYVRRSGRLIQFVSTSSRAWHAGLSCLNGLYAVNDFSIGIELEGCDQQPYEAEQYQQLIQLSRGLMHRYPAITVNRIRGHSNIAPGRKTDPGPCFNWGRYLRHI